MKYAILSNRRSLVRIRETDQAPTPVFGSAIEITAEQEATINNLMASGEIVFYWNDQFVAESYLRDDLGIRLLYNYETQQLEQVPIPLLPLSDRLKKLFNSLTSQDKAAFLSIASGVEWAVSNGDPTAAKLLIQGVSVPAELEAAKQALLAEFDKV